MRREPLPPHVRLRLVERLGQALADRYRRQLEAREAPRAEQHESVNQEVTLKD